MAKKSLTKKISYLLTLAVSSLLCFVMFFMTACATPAEPTNETKVTYTYTDVDNGKIANANFSFGQADTDYKNFPKSSINGWSSISSDNNAPSSDIPSGVVDVTEKGWEQLYENLYKDKDFLAYLQKRHGYDENVVVTNGMSEEEADEAIYNYVKENYLKTKLPNPVDANKLQTLGDTNIYMINNYDNTTPYATAQKIQSTSTVVVEAGKTAKISVSVKTANLKSPINDKNSAYEDFGANIRIINSFNGTTQEEYKISNVRDTEWTTYTIYVTADNYYECSLKLVLGLGYGNGSNNSQYAVEGTAYFDNITYEIVDKIPDGITSDKMVYASEEGKEKSANALPVIDGAKVAAYDMSIKNSYPDDFFTTIDFATTPDLNTTPDGNANYFYTKSNITDEDGKAITGKIENISTVSISTPTADKNKYPYSEKTLDLDITKAGYTINLKNGDNNFVIAPKNYTYVCFYMNIDAAAFATADATIYLHDILTYDSKTIDEKRNVNVVVSDTDGEWSKISFLVENNFEDNLYNGNTCTREFYFEIVFGPTSIASFVNEYELASGNIKITQPIIKTGTEPEEDDANYDLYTLITSNVNSSVSLYAGYASTDAWEEDKENETYSFTPSNAQIGTIVSQPANVDNYRGVVANHAFVNNNPTAESKINTRSGAGNSDGVAGLINTKYIDNYANSNDIKNALDYDNSESNIQPLMIYNITENSYGFIGDRTTVSPGANTLITVKVKLSKGSNPSANPVAYVYLVDSYSFDVMHFDDFTINSNLGHTGHNNLNNTEVNGEENEFAIKITQEMSDATVDGWVTVKFYIAAGATEKNFRIEVWNGSRDDAEKSAGYVFIESISSSTFTEAERWNDTFNAGYTLSDQTFTGDNDKLYIYQRPLTDTEKQFNSDYPDKAISYNPKYVWAKNDTTVYAIFNTIDPIISDPYSNVESNENTNGCTAKSDPSTFWLSFSSIVIASALILAIIALIIKTVVRKRKANASDAKSHFTVTSRIKSKKDTENKGKKNKKNKEKPANEDDVEETYSATVETTQDDMKPETSDENSNVEDYVYGEVQSFGSETEAETQAPANEEKPEDSTTGNDSEN